jgi:hypothetical protein
MPEKFVYFDGYKFTRDDKTGYYLNSTIRQRLHRYVWEFYNGPIPKGYHIHHKDFNKANNDISNLQLLSFEEHEKLHGEAHAADEGFRVWAKANLAKTARPKASEWHKSEEGREWHKKQFEKSRSKIFIERDFICENCGKAFKSTQTESRFCSNNCKSAWRRKAGLDNEKRICASCGSPFIVNKYSKTECCSRSCSMRLRHLRQNKEHSLYRTA